MNFRKWTLHALFKGTVQWGGKDWFGHDSLLQNTVVPLPTLIAEKKKKKKRSTGNNTHLLKPEIYTSQLLPEREKMFTP